MRDLTRPVLPLSFYASSPPPNTNVKLLIRLRWLDKIVAFGKFVLIDGSPRESPKK